MNQDKKTPYPERDSMFGLLFTKWLFMSGAASEVGPDATSLLLAIVTLEDEFRYYRAPNFYNPQLMERCGITSIHAFIRARKKAVDAGLLHYEPGAKRTPGRYFVTGIPDEVSVRNAQRKRKESEKHPERKRIESEKNPNTSTPSPNPNPNPNTDTRRKRRVCVSPPIGVDPIHWESWLQTRKSKRLTVPPTEAAMAKMQREADQARITLGEAIRHAAEREWGGFNAEWLTDRRQSNAPEHAPPRITEI